MQDDLLKPLKIYHDKASGNLFVKTNNAIIMVPEFSRSLLKELVQRLKPRILGRVAVHLKRLLALAKPDRLSKTL